MDAKNHCHLIPTGPSNLATHHHRAAQQPMVPRVGGGGTWKVVKPWKTSGFAMYVPLKHHKNRLITSHHFQPLKGMFKTPKKGHIATLNGTWKIMKPMSVCPTVCMCSYILDKLPCTLVRNSCRDLSGGCKSYQTPFWEGLTPEWL